MRARHFLIGVMSVTLSASLGFVTLSPALAAGDKKAASDDDKYDPNNVTHISKFMEVVVQGNAKFVSRDFPGAIELYRKAIQLQPTNPIGHYMLGEAQSASGNLLEAEASWQQADGAGDKNPPIKAKVLFCLADLKERQKKWDDAKTAWARYQTYVAGQADAGGVPQTATARIEAIDTAMKQDKAYDIVRQRIAAEKDAGK